MKFKIISLSIVLIIFGFAIFINFELISKNIFSFFDFYNKQHTPYYDLCCASITFFVLTGFVILTQNRNYLKFWLYKVGVTILFMMLYEFFYGLDATTYFGRAVVHENIPWKGQHGSAFIVYFNHVLSYIVGKSYYALKLVNSFIGFLGLILLYKSFEYMMAKSDLKIDPRLPYILFLLPSIIFWSSILGKDPLNLFWIGVFIYAFVHIIDTFKFSYVVMIAISIFAVSYIRSWYAAIMVASMFFYFLKLNNVRNIFFFTLMTPIFLIVVQQFFQMQGITSIDILFLKMTETTKNLSYGQSSVEAKTITGFGDYLLYYIPNLFTTLFRPMPWDIRNPFTLMAAVENTVMLYLTYKYIIKNWKNIYANKYLKFLILYIFSWSLIYVIISPANLGGAVRFKLQVLPVMVMLIGAAMAMQKKTEEAKEKEVVFLAK